MLESVNCRVASSALMSPKSAYEMIRFCLFKGMFLLSSSSADTSMLLWNTSQESYTPLRRMGGGGVHLVTWSQLAIAGPGCSSVLAATTSTTFRIWQTRTWTSDRWNVLKGNKMTFQNVSDPFHAVVVKQQRFCLKDSSGHTLWAERRCLLFTNRTLQTFGKLLLSKMRS